eukprot:TRINITY_DN29180_c0_g1_i1.p1 TRINITY_DN29180_c0_g1~~TRINITY_DN29180_c0_g1_i1.p1  ORF type:complete len:122 (+),score=3.20 TRINITY_DN29180_c0_g1_i1:195-560(+)
MARLSSLVDRPSSCTKQKVMTSLHQEDQATPETTLKNPVSGTTSRDVDVRVEDLTVVAIEDIREKELSEKGEGSQHVAGVPGTSLYLKGQQYVKSSEISSGALGGRKSAPQSGQHCLVLDQ